MSQPAVEQPEHREHREHRERRERARGLILKYGRDTVTFQGLGAQFEYWFDVDEDACVAYVDTGGAWVAAGGPACAAEAQGRVATRFLAAARASRRRACFFCVERPEALGHGFAVTRLGEQAELEPARWGQTLARHRRLREQLRRSRAKGVRVRRVPAHELAQGTALRATVDALAAAWLASRHLEPMRFLVAVDPHQLPRDRRYYLAEHRGRVVAFSWLVPIPARQGWLLEHTVRAVDHAAPNGTTELLLDAILRDAAEDKVVSLGLAPLSGQVPWPLRLIGAVSTPLYNFGSLRAFKQRLHPTRWVQSTLVYPRGHGLAAMLDSLRAFAGGSLLRFAARSFLGHPSGLPWLLAVPLVPWALVLAALAGLDDGTLLGFAPPVLAAWAAWDLSLAWLLFRVAQHPRRARLRWLAGAAALDASLSLVHLCRVGLGAGAVSALLRLAATIAPALGAAALAWAATRAPGRDA